MGSTIGRDDAGREVERFATGGIRITTDYNDMGLVRSRHVRSGNRHTGWRSYRWDVGARLMSMRGNLSPEPVIFDYDSMCNLVRGDYSMHERLPYPPTRWATCTGRTDARGASMTVADVCCGTASIITAMTARGNLITQEPQGCVRSGKQRAYRKKRMARYAVLCG